MPDGQIYARTNAAALRGTAGQGFSRQTMPSSIAACQTVNESLHAQNAFLLLALDRQKARAADLRSILCSLGMATLCLCPALKLRLFTVAAGHLLGIGPEDVGAHLSLSGPFGLEGTLMARIKTVLDSGIADEQVVEMSSGQLVLCRLLPLRAFEAVAPTIDGVIITFVAINPATVDLPLIGLPDCSTDGNSRHDEGALAAGYPDLGYGLTPRQHQVLGRVLAGQPSKNIAADLGISQRTVENHRAAIMARTGATSLPALTRLAIGADIGGDCKSSRPAAFAPESAGRPHCPDIAPGRSRQAQAAPSMASYSGPITHEMR